MTDSPHIQTRRRPTTRWPDSIGNRQSAIGNGPRAFTLIELMVVIAIILVLLGILIGGMGKFAAYSSTAAASQMMASIQMALSAYKTDFNDTPPSVWASGQVIGGVTMTTSWQGGEILVQALSGPRNDDGKSGLGFAAGGKNYGPYLSSKHESNLAVSTGTAPNAAYKYTLADSAGKKAVLYYHADPAAAITAGVGGVFGTGTKRFVKTHNDTLDSNDPATQNDPLYRYAASPLATIIKRPLSAGEKDSFAMSLRGAEYLMIYPGPDDIYGNDDDVIVTGK